MALKWTEERVVVTCADAASMGVELPDDAIVVILRPDEVDDPEAVESLRGLVLDRAIAGRQQMLEEIYEKGFEMPVPDIVCPEGMTEEVALAEQRLLDRLLKEEDEDDWSEGAAAPGADSKGRKAAESPYDMAPYGGGAWLGQVGGSGVRIFVGHVGELVVHN